MLVIKLASFKVSSCGCQHCQCSEPAERRLHVCHLCPGPGAVITTISITIIIIIIVIVIIIDRGVFMFAIFASVRVALVGSDLGKHPPTNLDEFFEFFQKLSAEYFLCFLGVFFRKRNAR